MVAQHAHPDPQAVLDGLARSEGIPRDLERLPFNLIVSDSMRGEAYRPDTYRSFPTVLHSPFARKLYEVRVPIVRVRRSGNGRSYPGARPPVIGGGAFLRGFTPSQGPYGLFHVARGPVEGDSLELDMDDGSVYFLMTLGAIKALRGTEHSSVNLPLPKDLRRRLRPDLIALESILLS